MARQQPTSIKFPTRRPCVACGTRKGKLRRSCPYCNRPVCGACYPQAHSCSGTTGR